MGLTIRQLEVFVSIAKSETMTQAAKVLFLSQSACSAALAELERHLKGHVFDRHGKRLVINERGKLILANSINILAQMAEIEGRLARTDGSLVSGHVQLVASSTIGNYVLPPMIGQFLSMYSTSTMALKVENTEQVIRDVLNYEADIGFIEGTCSHENVEVIPWKHDELVVIVAPTHTLATAKAVAISDLYHMNWILSEHGSGTREKFEEAIKIKMTPFLELGQTEAIKQAVQAGIGVSCVSRAAVFDELAAGQLVEIKVESLDLRRDFFILLHKKKYRSHAVSRFLREWCTGADRAFFPVI